MGQDSDKIGSIIKLALWLVFIVVLTLIAKFGDKVDEEENNFLEDKQPEVEIVSYEEKLNKLNSNYKYSYDIKVGLEIYQFVGSKMDTKESGYRITNNDEYLYYFLENGYTYSVINGGLDKIETIYNNIDASNVDVSMIKNSIQNENYQVVDNRYDYVLNNKNISIYTDSENIVKIETYIGEDYYKIDFIDIGLVEEINY